MFDGAGYEGGGGPRRRRRRLLRRLLRSFLAELRKNFKDLLWMVAAIAAIWAIAAALRAL